MPNASEQRDRFTLRPFILTAEGKARDFQARAITEVGLD
jgi:hypothetical protein